MDKNVDYEIEQFWLGFKVSMFNFYKNYENINRPIQQWSDYLNLLQQKKDYEGIEECIVKYISLYLFASLVSILDNLFNSISNII